jgi:hypothetical protein
MIAAGIDIVPDRAVNRAASPIANRTTPDIPAPITEIATQKVLTAVCSRRGALVSARLTGIEALLRTSLARSNVTVATQLALAVLVGLAALASLSVLTGAPVVASRARHGFNLISQPLDLIHELSLILLPARLFPLLRLAHRLARLLELLAQFRETLGDLAFRSPGGWIDTTPQPIRRSLHAVVEI